MLLNFCLMTDALQASQPSTTASQPIWLAPAVLAAVVGAFLTYAFTKVREDRARQVDNTLRYLQRQIEEFYGPIYNLIRQIFIAWEIKNDLLTRGHLDQAGEEMIDDYFATNYFTPLHSEINQIIKTKLYLLEGKDIPESIDRYLRHSLQERAQDELWKKNELDTSFLEGVDFPGEFYTDVHHTLVNLLAEYESVAQIYKAR